ncbi:MAG: HAD-IIIC family phosphatase [Terracidiphilus sp.]
MANFTSWPVDAAYLARNARKLIRQLRGQPLQRKIKIAILGGSTSQELALFLEVLLLGRGFDPQFWHSEYGRYWEDGALGNEELDAFAPELIYIHTGSQNIRNWPALNVTGDEAEEAAGAEIARFAQIWDSLQSRSQAVIFQNNFELPDTRILGNYDAVHPAGRVRFTERLNALMADEVRQRPYLVLNDVRYLSARVGLDNWYDPARWFSYKLATTPQASAELAFNLTALICARYGLSKKVLVLDLDNTVWGGVIGDDGVDGIVIGRETPRAEAHTHFQEYVRRLHQRGIVLAVASKNEDVTAREGFSHPDSVLKPEDFSSFKANWDPKHENIQNIAHELNLGLDSFVFADDNPAERSLVASQLPSVAVPEISEDAAGSVRILDRSQYFETLSLSAEDLARSNQYAGNAKRNELQAKFADYGEFLASLQMSSETGSFAPPYLERIAQLTGKTNQFNLTTKRYSLAEIDAIAHDPAYITRYIRLADRFGDNGLVSVAIGRLKAATLHIDLWLMSCRVLKRDVELLMLDELAAAARQAGATTLRGYFIRTTKNNMVSRHYQNLGFDFVSGTEDASEWEISLDNYRARNVYIRLSIDAQEAG